MFISGHLHIFLAKIRTDIQYLIRDPKHVPTTPSTRQSIGGGREMEEEEKDKQGSQFDLDTPSIRRYLKEVKHVELFNRYVQSLIRDYFS